MNEVTQKMIEKIQGYSYANILEKVQNEYDAGKRVAERKRPKLLEYLISYNVQGDAMVKGKHVKSKMLWTYRSLLVSALYKNRPIIQFEWRKEWDSEYADTWNNLLKFDYEELEEDIVMHNKISNAVDYWIYLAVEENWNKTAETPWKRLYSPLCWIPDPSFTITGGFNFHGFELLLGEDEINSLYQNSSYLLTDEEMKTLKEKLGDGYADWLRSWANGTGIGTDFAITRSPLRKYSVYRHFTKFNGCWYLTEWGNDRTLLLRCEKCEPVRTEEKKDEKLVPCPVVHNWIIPDETDPYGKCVGDIMQDNQLSEEKYLNLLIEKADEDTFSGLTIFDPSYIDGKELASKQIWKRKYLPAKIPLNNKIIENIQTQTSTSSEGYNIHNLLDAKSKREIWFDEQSIGIYSQTITATQSQILQANQNVRLSTMFKVFLWGEKRYWDVLWYRAYQKNFKMDSQKNIVLNSGIWVVTYTVKGKDLMTQKDLHLRLVSVLEKAEKDEANKAAMMASYQPLMQQASEFGKIQLTRKFARIVGLDKELVNMVYDYPPEYQQAMLDIELLNINEDPWEITNINENHNIYIQVYQQALDTEAKRKAIAARKRALLLSGQQQAQQIEQPVQMNASTNQLVSNYISQENKKNSQPVALGPNGQEHAIE